MSCTLCKPVSIQFDPALCPDLTFADPAAPTLAELDPWFIAQAQITGRQICDGDKIHLNGQVIAIYFDGQLFRNLADNWCPQLYIADDCDEMCNSRCSGPCATQLSVPFQVAFAKITEFDQVEITATPLTDCVSGWEAGHETFAVDLNVDQNCYQSEPITLSPGYYRLTVIARLDEKPRNLHTRTVRIA